MKNKDRFSSYCNNRCRQSIKRFCKRFGHNIETCYHHNKSAVSISTTTATATDIESIQPMAPISTKSTTSGSTITISTVYLVCLLSRLMDSACCNHMTPHPHNIHIENGSTISGHNIGSVSTANLSVPRVFNVLNLSYNLFSVGQLAELGYRITFDYSGCIVQDPMTGQELGTGSRVGRMFLVDNLRLPLVAPFFVVAIVSSIPSLALCHARLGHASSSRVQQLAFRDLLGSVSIENFDFVSC